MSENEEKKGAKLPFGSFANLGKKATQAFVKKKAAKSAAKKTLAKGMTSVGGSAGAPVIAIIIGILIFMFLFSVFYKTLTPENAYTVVEESLKTKVEDVLNDIKDFLKDLFHIGDTIEKIEADEDSYDPDNENDVGLIENFNAINTALNYTYDKYVLDYIEDYCKKEKCDSNQALQLINANYPNGWKDVYSNVNYGELICILSLGYKTYAYGPSVPEGDVDALFDFLSNDSSWKYFFEINIQISETAVSNEGSTEVPSESTETGNDLGIQTENKLVETSTTPVTDAIDSGSTTNGTESIGDTESTEQGTTATTKKIITSLEIYPFCKKNLFSALRINPDADYYDELSFNEMLELKTMHVLSMCENYDGTKRTIYDTIGLDNPYATWDYSFSSISAANALTNINILDIEGDNASIIWKYLKEAGFTDEGASGILGNLQAENGLSTAMSGHGGSVGLAQWTGNRRKALENFATAMNRDVTDINVQAAFLVQELSSPVYNCIRTATDVILAADYAAYYYEVCSRYASKEGYLNGKYNGVIAWERYVYSETFHVYILDLAKRRGYSQAFYASYAQK